jgi:hypothetical protein
MANVIIVESNNWDEYETELGSTLTSFSYKSIDSPAFPDEDRELYPVRIPHAGYYWSCLKWWRFKVPEIGASASVSNFKVWLSGTLPDTTNLDVFVLTGADYRVSGPYHTYDSAWRPPITGTWYSMKTSYYDLYNTLSISGTVTADGGYSDYFCHALRATSDIEDDITFSNEPYFSFDYTVT